MTEIPEHLLKRSQERRVATGGDDTVPAPDTALPGGATDVPPSPAPTVPAPAAVPDAPARRPEVAAAQQRRKIPFWAMPVLAGLPLWAYVYQATLEPAPAGEDDPVALGEAVYSSCGSCHGDSGEGVGSFPALTGVLETWPDYRDHMMWVRLGDPLWPGDAYGANDKPKTSGMPSHDFGDEVLAQVVLYERVTFGGLEVGSEEFLALEAIALGDTTFAQAGLGDESAEAGVDEAALTAG